MFYCRTFLHYSQAWHILHGNRCHICRFHNMALYIKAFFTLWTLRLGRVWLRRFCFLPFFWGLRQNCRFIGFRFRLWLMLIFGECTIIYLYLNILFQIVIKTFNIHFLALSKRDMDGRFFFLAQSQFSAMKLDPINIQKIVNKFIVILIQCHSEKWMMYILKVR